MKRLITSFLFMFALANISALLAQTTVYYAYDNSGNRIYRGVIKIDSKKSGQIIDTTSFSEEKTAPKVFEETQENLQIRIFPNPTRGQLRVEVTSLEPSVMSSISIYSLSGTLVTIKKPLSGNDILDITNCPIGTYVLRVQIGDKTSEWLIMKE